MIPIARIEDLFERHYRSAVFYAQRIVKVKEVAEDVVQGIFLRLMSEDVILRGSLDSYLYAAVHNRSLDYLRGVRNMDTEVVLCDIATPEIADDVDFQRTMRVRRLYDSIEKLPEKCRQIFVMVQLENYTYAEAAEALGISVNTVRTQMYRASCSLKEKLHVAWPSLLLLL